MTKTGLTLFGQLLAICLLLITPHWAAAQSAQSIPLLQEDTQQLSLHGAISVLIDTTGKLDVQAASEGQFSPIPADFKGGYSKDVVWLEFSVQRSASAPPEWWLVVPTAHLESLILYQQQPDDTFSLQERRLGADWQARSVKSNKPVFILDLPTTEVQYFLLRLETRSAQNVDLVIWEPKAYQEESIKSTFLIGGFLISSVIMFAINLFYWSVFRQRLFGVFVFYIGFIGFYFFVIEGYYDLFVKPEAQDLVTTLRYFLNPLMVYALFWLFIELVKPQQRWPRLTRLLHLVALLSLLTTFALVLLQENALAVSFNWYYLLLLFIGTIIITVLKIPHDRRAALFLVAFAPLILTVSMRLFLNFGWVGYNWFYDYAVFYGLLLHWLLLQLIVFAVFNQVKRNEEIAREALLQATQRSEAVLESKVQERTIELQQENAERTRIAKDLELARERLTRALDEEHQTSIAQRQFLRIVGHEFRTPLSTIGSAIDLLQEKELRTPDNIERILERLRAAVERMSDLVNRALAMDRFEGTVWRANAATIDLPKLLEKIVAQTHASHTTCYSIQIDCPDEKLQGDPELLEICFYNLLDNAIKYSPTGSEIKIKVSKDAEGNTLISLCDQGPGVSDEDKKDIFSKYWRSESTESQVTGLGLGLYLARQIAKLHGGDIGVTDHYPQGACFEVSIAPVQQIEKSL